MVLSPFCHRCGPVTRLPLQAAVRNNTYDTEELKRDFRPMFRCLSFAKMRAVAVLGTVALLAGCAGSTTPAPGEINDPYEVENRRTHEFNKALLGGLSSGSDTPRRAIVPEEIKSSAVHFANNLGEPSTVVNALLQGNLERAGRGTLRFVINSTVGMAGLFDVAGDFGLSEDDTDFGETLHVWGVPEGNYIELPVLGPSTERDTWGRVVDVVIDPLGYALTPRENNIKRVAKITGKAIEAQRLSGSIDAVLEGSADSYAQARSIYLQNRRYELAGENAAEATAIDPLDIDTEGF